MSHPIIASDMVIFNRFRVVTKHLADQQSVEHKDTPLVKTTSAANRSVADDSPISRRNTRSKGQTKLLLSSQGTDHERDNLLDKYGDCSLFSGCFCNMDIFSHLGPLKIHSPKHFGSYERLSELSSENSSFESGEKNDNSKYHQIISIPLLFHFEYFEFSVQAPCKKL